MNDILADMSKLIAEISNSGVEVATDKTPAYRNELEWLRKRFGMSEEEIQRRYAEIGFLPATGTDEPFYHTPIERLPSNPKVGSKWAERRAHLEGKR